MAREGTVIFGHFWHYELALGVKYPVRHGMHSFLNRLGLVPTGHA